MSQIFCTNCGAALAPEAAFCGSCGTRVEADAPPSPPAGEIPAPPPSAAPPIPDYVPPPAPEPQVPPPAYDAPPVPAPIYQAPPAAPVYAGPVPAAAVAPVASGDTDWEQRASAYVGQNADHYLDRWRQLQASGKSNSWNWAAFLLNAFWLASRKMWMPALATVGAILLLQILGLFSPALFPLTSGLSLGICAFVGWRGNGFYRAQTDRAVMQAETMTQDRQAQMAWLRGQGGASLPAGLGLAGGVALVWFLLLFVVAKEMNLGSSRSAYSTYDSSSSSSTGDSGAISPAFLQGHVWRTSCSGPGTDITFSDNGRFFSSVGVGNWLLVGDLLTLFYTDGHGEEQMTVRQTSPTQFSFVEGNRTGVLNRC